MNILHVVATMDPRSGGHTEAIRSVSVAHRESFDIVAIGNVPPNSLVLGNPASVVDTLTGRALPVPMQCR